MALFSRLMSTVVLSVILSASALARQETPAFPFEGEVTCENLNVRLAPKKDAGTAVAAVIRQGEKVTVVAESGDYFVIRPPKSATVWVLGRHIKRDGEGSTGTVLANEVPVRIDSRANADKLATLSQDAKVTILREHLGWFQIAAPDEVKYYAAKQYVKFVGAAAAGTAKVAAPKAIDHDGEARAMIREAERLTDGQNRLIADGKIAELDFSAIVAAYEAASGTAKSADLKKSAEASARNFRNFNGLLVAVKGNMEATNKLIEANRAELKRKYEEVEPRWEATGYLDTVGMLRNRPGSYKLVMGDKVVCFIKVKEDDIDMVIRLNGFYQQYVGIKGTVSRDPEGWEGYSVVSLESIEAITKK